MGPIRVLEFGFSLGLGDPALLYMYKTLCIFARPKHKETAVFPRKNQGKAKNMYLRGRGASLNNSPECGGFLKVGGGGGEGGGGGPSCLMSRASNGVF